MTIDTKFEATSGTYKPNGKQQNGHNIYAGPNGAILAYEKKGNGWAATHWIKSDCWAIGQGGHHRYGLATKGPAGTLVGSTGWKTRVSAQLPISFVGGPPAPEFEIVTNDHASKTTGK